MPTPTPNPSKLPPIMEQGPVRLHTSGYQCFSVKFGSFERDCLAVATGTNFGMRGPGRLYVFSASTPSPLKTVDVKDGLYDVAWSETSQTVLAGASADGSVILFDLNRPDGIARIWENVHAREVSSVDWNVVNKTTFLSSSLDGSVKLWDPLAPRPIVASIQTKPEQPSPAYEVAWCPRDAFVFAVASGRSLAVFDIRAHPAVPQQSLDSVHEGEILCLDWNKYENFQIATGSVDQSIKIWDLRSAFSSNMNSSSNCLQNLMGHYRAVKKLRFSPFSRSHLVSGGYDMTVRYWDITSLNPAVLPTYEGHTEFVTGLSWSLLHPGLISSCAWDDSCHILPFPKTAKAIPEIY